MTKGKLPYQFCRSLASNDDPTLADLASDYDDWACVRLRPTHRNHVWSYDFISERTHDGRALKIMTLIDEFSRNCVALLVERHITNNDLLFSLADLFIRHWIPDHIRSDNGPEFTAKAVQQ